MRQGQQNRRGRGRSNNNNNSSNGNRKSQNPLTRSFESSGPDIKIRGTPSHIAEKYVTLARDALSSGDPVLAESYLQHAEHYNRIILSFREQQLSQGAVDPFQNGVARTHNLGQPDSNDPDDMDEEEGGGDFGNQPQPMAAGQVNEPQQAFVPSQPQPQQQQRNFDQPYRNDNRQRQDGNRFNNNRHDRGDGLRNDRDFRGDRQDRFDRSGSGNGEHRFRDDRRPQGQGEGGGYQGGDNGYRRRDRYQGPNGYQGNNNTNERDLAQGGFQPTQPVSSPVPAPSQPPSEPAEQRPQASPTPAPAAAVEQQEQPAFLRRPVRRPRREEPAEQAAAETPPTPKEEPK